VFNNRRVEIYTDGSEREGRAGFGTWCESEEKIRTAYRVLGAQTSYNGELQGAIFGVCNAPPKTICNICIDNEAVVKLGKKIKEGKRIDMNKVPQPHLVRLLKDRVEWKKEIEQTTINFVKVAGHTGIKGNEEADIAAKVGVELDFTYLERKDLVEFQNDWVLEVAGEELLGNYRAELKKKHQKQIIERAKEDRNTTWRRLMNVECIKSISNGLTKDKKVGKQIVNTIMKARADLLPHAAQLVDRKCENIRSPYCPWCNGKIENTEHIMVECPEYEKERIEIRDEVWEIIRGENKANNTEQMKEAIPVWFFNKPEKILTPYAELRNYDKLAGILGFIPREVNKVVRDYRNNGRSKKEELSKKQKREEERKIKNILGRIHRRIIKGAYRIWLRRNEKWSKMANGEAAKKLVRERITEIKKMSINTNKFEEVWEKGVEQRGLIKYRRKEREREENGPGNYQEEEKNKEAEGGEIQSEKEQEVRNKEEKSKTRRKPNNAGKKSKGREEITPKNNKRKDRELDPEDKRRKEGGEETDRSIGTNKKRKKEKNRDKDEKQAGEGQTRKRGREMETQDTTEREERQVETEEEQEEGERVAGEGLRETQGRGKRKKKVWDYKILNGKGKEEESKDRKEGETKGNKRKERDEEEEDRHEKGRKQRKKKKKRRGRTGEDEDSRAHPD
jgi:hypothetical protein